MRNGFFKDRLMLFDADAPDSTELSMSCLRIDQLENSVINGSDFPNDDAPSLCGTRDGDDKALRKPGR
jgi:hypothetical protein